MTEHKTDEAPSLMLLPTLGIPESHPTKFHRMMNSIAQMNRKNTTSRHSFLPVHLHFHSTNCRIASQTSNVVSVAIHQCCEYDGYLPLAEGISAAKMCARAMSRTSHTQGVSVSLVPSMIPCTGHNRLSH